MTKFFFLKTGQVSAELATNEPMELKCDLATFKAYKEQGLWQEIVSPKYYKMSIAVVQMNVLLKGKDGYRKAFVYVSGFYNSKQVAL